MRVSGLMYLLEQLHCALWLLLALGLAAGQVRPEPLRLLCTALCLGGLTLVCALLPFPWLRFAALALSAVLAPQAAWQASGFPERRWHCCFPCPACSLPAFYPGAAGPDVSAWRLQQVMAGCVSPPWWTAATCCATPSPVCR